MKALSTKPPPLWYLGKEKVREFTKYAPINSSRVLNEIHPNRAREVKVLAVE